jgi:hypothetical protein
MHAYSTMPPGPQLGAAIAQSTSLSDWLQSAMKERSLIEATNRTRAALAYTSMAMEHREAFMLLIGVRAYASAMALARSMLEAYVLSLWVAELQDDSSFHAHVVERREPPGVANVLQRIVKRAPDGRRCSVTTRTGAFASCLGG